MAHPKNVACDETEKIDYNDGREMPAQAQRMDQIEYNERNKNLKNQYEKINEKLSKIEDLKFEMRTKKHKVEGFIEHLKQNSELLTNFNEKIWYALIEKVTVNAE